ncbi:MAG: DUF1549 domain-containing protein [Planctomycetaceae bacterium]
MTRFLTALAVVFAVGVVRAAEDAVPPQVAEINGAIEQQWKDFEIRPAPDADDATWCRRVYLDVIGRIPTLAELTEFAQDRAAGKRQRLVTKLLYDDRYAEEYANHWSTVWCNLLIGRSGGEDDRSLTSRDGMLKYLRDSFAANKPYDKFVYELVTATGSTKPGTDGFNGATNFLIDKVNEEKAVLATSSTSRIFLGLQVQCTQCHNHPFNQWEQQTFWDFNAFFRQTRGLRRFVDGTRDIDHAELVDEDFAGEAGDPNDAMIFYDLRNGLTKVAYPVFIDDTAIGVSGYVSEVNRRQELGRLMTTSEFLEKMLVNRMWSHFLGFGFTKPVDDLGPHNAATHPDLLEYLGGEVRKNSFDMKQLMLWITLSKPYQLSAKHSSTNEVDDPSIGETPKFSHFYLRQMTAEQLYQSLVAASGGTAKGTYEQQERQRREWLRQFVVAFGTDEGDEATTFNGSIPQALMLFNGDLTKQAISDADGGFLKRIASQGKSPRDRVTALFLTGLARRPTTNELTIANKLMMAREGKELSMLQDLWWAIINSNEFIMQH